MAEKGAINMVIAPATKTALSVAGKGAVNVITASAMKIAVSVAEEVATDSFTETATKTALSVAGKGAVNVITASAALVPALIEGGKMAYNEYRRRQREETNKVLEPKMDEHLQDLNNKIKSLQEDFRKSEESTKNEFQKIRAELEKSKENNEMGIVCLLVTMLDQNIQQLSKNIQTLEEEVKEWPETTKGHLENIRGDLEKKVKKEEKIATELKSKLDENFQQLSQKIQTLEEEVKEWSEKTKHDLQLLRGDLEKKVKEGESSMALQCRTETLLQQLLQRVQTLEQTRLTQEFQLFRAYRENNQGIAMQREEIIHLRVLELAGGERINNIWTDSRSAFGTGPAQGAVWNRRLHEARGFFRSVSGGEVEQFTPGASDNLHANQDQRTACLDSLVRSIEGIQRSMDIRASRTNDLQVLMLTLGVLISIIILARIFTLPWP